MASPLSPSAQDYLKSIYDLACEYGNATTSALAERLNVTPASVTGMLQKLASASPPLVSYRKHQGARLSQAGEQAALEIIRHHRLIETYLVTVLGYTWDNVHEEACRLEHAISEELEARIAERLGNPERDPHGEPIPSAALEMPQDQSRPLAESRPGARVRIERVRAHSPAFLRHIDDLGLLPGTVIDVLSYSGFDQNLSLRTRTSQLVLGPLVTEHIFVTTIELGTEGK